MNEEPSLAPRKGRVWPVVKLLLFCLVVVFVFQRAAQIWKAAPAEPIELHAIWLIPAMLAYLIGWLPSVWLWTAMLRRLRQPITFGAALRAHYVGQLGKYVPGKALVLVIRGAMVKDLGVDPVLAGLTAGYETLVFMAAGAGLAIAIAPWAFGAAFWSRLPPWASGLSEHRIAFAIAILAGMFATTPLSAWLFTKLGRKTASRSGRAGGNVPAISASLVSQGVIATSVGWLLHALSLGFVLQAISKQPFDLFQFPVWLEAVSCSTVGGFVVLIAPGGLGVREGLLIETLKGQSHIGPAMAVVAAGLLRAVWFVSEVMSAAVLYMIHRRATPDRRLASVANSREAS